MSRPELPRYSISSTSYLSFSDPRFPNKNVEREDFLHRRLQLTQQLRALPYGLCEPEESEKKESVLEQKIAALKSEETIEEEKQDFMDLGNYTRSSENALLFESSADLYLNELKCLESFHEVLSELERKKEETLTFSERISKYEKLNSLVDDFLHEAEAYGKVILQEINQPPEGKTFFVCFFFFLSHM
jgi:hypothetical protein